LNKLIPLLAFSILLLVPVGAQNAFADSGLHTIIIDPPLPPNLAASPVTISGTINPPSTLPSLHFVSITSDIDGTFAGCDVGISNWVCILDSPLSLGTHTLSFTLFPPGSAEQVEIQLIIGTICGPGTVFEDGVCVCEQQNNQCVGGVIIDTDTVSLLAGAIGIDPLLTGLIGITIGGLAVQAVWFVHRRKKKVE